MPCIGTFDMKQRTNPAARTLPAAHASLAPAIQSERALVMDALRPIVSMLGTIVGPNIEVVLHDLSQPDSSVVAIANASVSQRAIGSAPIDGPTYDKSYGATRQALAQTGQAGHAILPDYVTMTSGGQELRSSTVVFRDANGVPYATLCLNADLSLFHTAHAWLERLLQPKAAAAVTQPQPAEMDTLVKEIISGAVRTFNKPVGAMTKEEKIHAVREMMQRGLFMVRGGVEHAATALHVSRFTIYNYQEELRRREAAQESGTPACPPNKPGRQRVARA